MEQQQFFDAMDTGELADIWKKNDRTQWSDDTFNLIEQILKDRGQPLEGQASAVAVADPYQALQGKKGSVFGRLWRGEEPLASAYWQYGVLPNAALSLMARIGEKSGFVAIVALLFWLIYFPIAGVGIWRSAGRYTGFWLWPALARVMVVLPLLAIVGGILGLLFFG